MNILADMLQNLLSAVSGFHAYGLAAFTHILGMDAAEADKICNNAIAVARNKNHHVYSY